MLFKCHEAKALVLKSQVFKAEAKFTPMCACGTNEHGNYQQAGSIQMYPSRLEDVLVLKVIEYK